MAMARDLQGQALAATEAGEKADLALAFQRTARSVRQTIALKAQLERDRARRDRDDREDRAETDRLTAARVQAHVARVRNDVKRIVWDELEPADARFVLQELNEQIAEMALADDFCAVPVNIHVMHFCAELGVFEGSDADDDAEDEQPTFPVAAGSEPQAPVGAPDCDPGEALRRSSA